MEHLKKFKANIAYHFSELLEKPIAKPLWIYLSLSHRCTYHCSMCSVVDILHGYELPKDSVKRIFDEISRWDANPTIVITGGEPFLRKDIFEIIDYGFSKGLKLEAVSNGFLITPGIADKIISSGLQNIAVSLDGARAVTHDTVRQKGAFDKATGAVRNLAESKKRKERGPQISAWTTIMKENVRELSELIPLSRDLGVECLVYHPVIVAQDDMQNTSSKSDFWLSEEDVGILKEQIDRIVSYQKKYGLVAFLHDPHLWVAHFKGLLSKKEWKCNPFVFINVGPDGNVRSCGPAFGNIEGMSLEACLNSPDANLARKRMKECSKPCLQTCWANPESDSLSVIIDTLIEDVKKDAVDKGKKAEVLTEALNTLADYEDKVKECVN